jgi:hypothetical protein
MPDLKIDETFTTNINRIIKSFYFTHQISAFFLNISNNTNNFIRLDEK